MVLINKPHYKKVIFQHLNDANTYQKTDQKFDYLVMKKIGESVNKYESLLTKRRNYTLQALLFHQVIFMDYQRLINLNK